PVWVGGIEESTAKRKRLSRWIIEDKSHVEGGDWGFYRSGFYLPGMPPGPMTWVRYQHIPRWSGKEEVERQPELITDFLGYNVSEPGASALGRSQNWVGDLILECRVCFNTPSSGDELVMELSRGVDRFRARWDLTAGTCTLTREQTVGQEQVL